MTPVEPVPGIAQNGPFEAAHDHFARLVTKLSSQEVKRMQEADVERLVRPEGTETMRLLMQGFISSLGRGEVVGKVIGADGGERTHKRLSSRELETIYGTVRIERFGYSQRETQPLFPLDAQLNLPPHRYSHEVSRQLVFEVAKTSFDEALATLARTTGAAVNKRQAQELTVLAATDFDEFYKQAERAALLQRTKSGPVLVITADGKGVVVRCEDLREATKKKAAKRKHAMTSRLGSGQKKNVKRMAEVAAVYTIRRHHRDASQVIAGLRRLEMAVPTKPPKPEQKRVWASVKQDMEVTLDAAFAEAVRRDPARRKDWVGLVDGNKEQIKGIISLAKQYEVSVLLVIDFIHVLEYLWKAGHEQYEEGQELENWVLERAERILNGEASLVAAAIRRSATMKKAEAEERKATDKCADYLVKHAKFMRYDICLKKGYPIATGVVEGACRHLVKDRMDLTGARWGLERAEAVLQLRALRASGDFDGYWAFHELCEHHRNHQAHYRGPIPSVVVSPTFPNDAHQVP